MVTGQGSTTEILSADGMQELLAGALDPMLLDGKRVLVIIPDGTRTAPIPLWTPGARPPISRRSSI